MTVAKRLLGSPETYVTNYLTTGLNALANNAGQVGAAINNSTLRYSLLQVKVTLGSLTPTAGGAIDIYVVPGDGTDYNEGDNTNLPQDTWLAFSFSLRAGAAAQKLLSQPLPANYYFKLGLVNRSGVALAATGNILDYRFILDSYET